MVAGEPIRAVALDAQTVQVTYAGPSGPGVRLLDNLPIYPKHQLDAARVAGTIAKAWPMTTAPSDLAGTGPFVFRSYQPGQRVVLDRNPRYWRKAENGTALPYLDRIVLEIVPDQNAELLRVQSGAIDMVQDALRPEDFRSARQAESEGRIKLVELGVATDADAFWFCLKPEIKNKDPRFAFVQKPEFRKAISHAVDREEFSNTVFLGEAVPVWGPITPGNRDWFNPNVTRYLPDLARARELLSSIGLEDRNGNGIREDVRGTEARFTLMTQQGPGWYARGTKVLQEQAGKIGITFELALLEPGLMIQRMLACDFDAIYMRPLATRSGPGGQHGLLALIWFGAFLEPGTEEASNGVGTADRHVDASAGGHCRSSAAPCAVRPGTEHPRRELAGAVFRGGEDAHRPQCARRWCPAIRSPSTDPVDCRHALRRPERSQTRPEVKDGWDNQ